MKRERETEGGRDIQRDGERHTESGREIGQTERWREREGEMKRDEER